VDNKNETLGRLNSTNDFVFFGLQSWDIDIGSNCKNMAIEVAKTNRVLYINRALDRKSKYFDKKNKIIQHRLEVFRKGELLIEQVQENLWVCTPSVLLESINWIKMVSLFNFFNRLNNKRLSKDIKEAINKLGFKDVIFFNDNDFFRGVYLYDLLKPSIYIYYIRDYLNFQPYFKRHGNRLEPETMRRSDLVVSNSNYLTQYAQKHNKNSFFIGQGCDFSQFDASKSFTMPKDLEKIKAPIIGYVGVLHSDRLDINLLVDVATKLPEYSFVLVGPEDAEFSNSKLHTIANVYFLGPKDVDSLAAYIAHFNVCINPQKLNELTIGNYPRKIDEYLAMGKNVVATQTETMKLFSDYVYLCSDADSYIEAITKACSQNNNDSASRIDFAKTHTWKNNVKELFAAIEKAR